MAHRYPGHIPAVVKKDAKYSVVHRGQGGMAIRLIYSLGHGEMELLTTDAHDRLVKMVNEVKEEHAGMPGGAFYINEYGHVLVPAEGEYYFAGTYDDLLEFEFDGDIVCAEAPDDVEPGDPWPGPHVGVPYVLAAGGGDIKYELKVTPTRIRVDRLSDHVGQPAAAKLSRRFAAVKGSAGGKIYINEARELFAPKMSGYQVTYVYVGHLEDGDPWFPEPELPA